MRATELEDIDSDTAREELNQTQEEDSQAPYLYAVTSQTPWWIVSIMLHALIIVLAGLISMAIEMPKGDDVQITVTTVLQQPEVPLKPVVATSKPTDLLPNNPIDFDGDTTDPHKALNILVTDFSVPISDKWRTDNNGNDDDGCQGVENARVYDPIGKIDEPGGGGKNGEKALADGVIGFGIVSSGRGGGDGGGDGTGFGPDSGRGTGTIGNGRLGNKMTRCRTFGITKAGEDAVASALRWLAYHQEPDGHWDSKKYGGVKVDTANTGFALLAFPGAGHTEKIGEYRDNVRRAVQWLKSKQAANGLVYDTTDEGGHRGVGYPHAIATMALVEAAGMANVKETRDAAQKAVDYAVQLHQCGEGSEKLGFRYAAKQAGDLSVTGWYAMALKSAKVSGMKVDHAAFEGVLNFINKVEIKNAAQGDYGAASRFGYTPGGHINHRLGAIGNLCRQFMGWRKEELQASVELFMKDGGVPSWGANGESVDLYYWYYGALCVFQQGGDLWKQWNAGMVKSLCENQRRDGDDTGSWDPKGPYSGDWGRVGQTALGALCLEVYYRYELQNK